MNLRINGEDRLVEDVQTVNDLLTAFKLQQKILVVEVNKHIIERTQYDDAMLSEGDAVEIVHFVGGG